MLLLIAFSPEEAGSFNPFDPASFGGFLWTWVIFLVALPFMWKVVMGKVVKALEERDGRATAAIASAEEASRAAERARAEVEARLAQAQLQASQLVDAARARAEVRERELVGEAERASQALLERARAEIQSEQDKAIANIRREVVDLSIKAASQVLKRKVDSADDRRLIEELVSATREGRK